MKAKQKTANQDDAEQSKAFIEKAREIQADEEHSAAGELMKRLGKTPPEPHVKKDERAKGRSSN